MANAERRELVFDASELRACLRQVALPSGIGSRPDKPLDIELHPAENCIWLRYDPSLDPRRAVVTLEGAALAVILMKWCTLKSIPLPKSGTKFLRIEGDSVVLIVENRIG